MITYARKVFDQLWTEDHPNFIFRGRESLSKSWRSVYIMDEVRLGVHSATTLLASELSNASLFSSLPLNLNFTHYWPCTDGIPVPGTKIFDFAPTGELSVVQRSPTRLETSLLTRDENNSRVWVTFGSSGPEVLGSLIDPFNVFIKFYWKIILSKKIWFFFSFFFLTKKIY